MKNETLTDCNHYRTNVPCTFHKEDGRRCPSCMDYSHIDNRILIIKLDSLGDIVRTTACLRSLKRIYPGSHVTWVTRGSDARDLLALNPEIDRILTVESNYLELLLCEEFDVSICPDAGVLEASIHALARATEKRGFVANGRGGIQPLNSAAESWWKIGIDDVAKRANRRTYGEWLYAICELPGAISRPHLEPTRVAREWVSSLMQEVSPLARRRICFNTGAGDRWQEKGWKMGHYLDLAARILTRSDQGTVILLAGGPKEKDMNRALSASDPRLIDCGTALSIDRFVGLIEACEWVFTPDSLGYHVACAVGTPAVCVVGPTSPWELDTYGTNQILFSDIECIACYRSQCPLAVTCMDRLTAEVVWPHVPCERTALRSSCTATPIAVAANQAHR